jgi:hypothetical protein
VFGERAFVDAGGLMSYGISFADLLQRLPTYMDNILRGAKPADLPVEQGFVGLPRPSHDRALWALRFWLDAWPGTLADERDGHRVGAYAVARDAAGRVGSVEEGRNLVNIAGAAK